MCSWKVNIISKEVTDFTKGYFCKKSRLLFTHRAGIQFSFRSLPNEGTSRMLRSVQERPVWSVSGECATDAAPITPIGQSPCRVRTAVDSLPRGNINVHR